MFDTNFDQNHTCSNGLHIQGEHSYDCKRCERFQKFEQLLNRLTIASKAVDYVEQINATITDIYAVCAQSAFSPVYSLF